MTFLNGQYKLNIKLASDEAAEMYNLNPQLVHNELPIIVRIIFDKHQISFVGVLT